MTDTTSALLIQFWLGFSPVFLLFIFIWRASVVAATVHMTPWVIALAPMSVWWRLLLTAVGLAGAFAAASFGGMLNRAGELSGALIGAWFIGALLAIGLSIHLFFRRKITEPK
jgi:hypothetical protein